MVKNVNLVYLMAMKKIWNFQKEIAFEGLSNDTKAFFYNKNLLHRFNWIRFV